MIIVLFLPKSESTDVYSHIMYRGVNTLYAATVSMSDLKKHKEITKIYRSLCVTVVWLQTGVTGDYYILDRAFLHLVVGEIKKYVNNKQRN